MNKRYYVVPLLICAAAATAAASGTGEDKTRFAHRTGRVAANLPEGCSFRICSFGDERLGIRWPGSDGTEFLGEIGFYLRFRMKGEDEGRVISPSSFFAIDPGFDAGPVYEGANGGIRYPLEGCDDDGDGAIDEDPFDYLDNDADGKTDEDFGVIGNQMAVTRGMDPRTGMTLVQSSYTWAYGHVRDFIGVTSIFRYPEDEDRPGQGKLLDITAVLSVGLEAGPGDDPDRSDDDRYFFIDHKDEETAFGLEGPAHFPAVSDGGSEGFCAVAVFGFEAPGVSGRAFDCVIADTSASFYLEKPEAAEKTVAYRFAPVPELVPGGELRVDWAIVFGSSEKSLSRNITRAIETYRGAVYEDGRVARWVVPARKASYVRLSARLAPVWVGGDRKPAASIILPEMNDEELELIKVGQKISESYERIERRLMVPVDDELMEEREGFVIEGQFTDGTIFTAGIGQEEMDLFASGETSSPERLPEEFMSVYPNPFVSNLNIRLRIAETSGQLQARSGAEFQGISSVRIYDVKGRLVRTIMPDEYLHPGEYDLGWDGNDDSSMPVSPGVYYCKLQIEERTLTKRVILLR